MTKSHLNKMIILKMNADGYKKNGKVEKNSRLKKKREKERKKNLTSWYSCCCCCCFGFKSNT